MNKVSFKVEVDKEKVLYFHQFLIRYISLFLLLQMSLSDSRKVILRSVSLKTSGLFRCEVSAEAPTFSSAQSEARMEVVCK